jgi:AcrR family transcriptional regulator
MRAETQRRLVEAAAEVFAERGFAGASLEAISKRAGYTRGAFHWYFSSKDELLVAVLRERLARRIEATDDTVMQAEGPLAFNRVQRQQAGRVPSAERRQWSLLMLEFWLHAVRQPDLRKEGARLKADLRAAMTKQVERLLDSVSAEPPLAPDLLASALIALEDGFALQELLDPEDHPSEKLWDVLDFFAESVLQRSERPS